MANELNMCHIVDASFTVTESLVAVSFILSSGCHLICVYIRLFLVPMLACRDLLMLSER